jgi:galactose mutarotase-like enzyme
VVDLQASQDSGFEVLQLDNGVVSVVVVPALGGKLSSLRDLRSGREWLWRSDQLPWQQHPYGTSYVELADTGGWDECFPTVAPCSYPRRELELPDHGEVWSSAWDTTVEQTQDAVTVTTVARGVALPYRFIRVLSLQEGAPRLQLDYTVDEVAQDLDFIWSAHPLFRLEADMSVRLPEDAALRVFSAQAGVLPEEPLRWPFALQGATGPVDLATLPGPEAGVAFKVWTEPLSEGWAELRARDGLLRFVFDVSEVPQVGLWLNAGGWSGTGAEPYWNLALEPCIGAQDSLQEAVEVHGLYRTIAAGSTATWSLGVELQA